MPSEKDYNRLYIDIAKRIAQMSKAVRLQVGAIVVKNHSIISYGYNGTPTGDDNCCETRVGGGVPQKGDKPDDLVSKEDVVHAEMNALLKLVGSTESVRGATMYITHSPCLPCCRFIVQTNKTIKEVIYDIEYRDTKGIDYLKSKGISVRKAVFDDIHIETNKSNMESSVVEKPSSIPFNDVQKQVEESGGFKWQKAVSSVDDLVEPKDDFMITLITGDKDISDAIHNDPVSYAVSLGNKWWVYILDKPISPTK